MDLDELNALDLGLPQAATQEETTAPEASDIEEEAGDIEAGSEEQTEQEGSHEEGADDPLKGYVDITIDGQTYRVPEALKDGYYRNKDYTEKTQALSNEKKAFEAHKADIERAGQVTEQEFNLRVELQGMAEKLQQYEQVNWDQFEAQDYTAAQSEFRRFQQLQSKFNAKYGELQTAQNERSQIMERDTASRIQATTEYAYKNLPGMSPELDQKITKFAIDELGFTPDRLKAAYNPQIYRMLYLAHLGHQTATKPRVPPKAPQPPAKPTTVITPRGNSGSKTPAQMSVAEMDAYLNKRR